MTFQIGKNPEYTIYLYLQPKFIALPLQIGWFYYNAGDSKNYSVSLHFLCFGFEFEIWRYRK